MVNTRLTLALSVLLSFLEGPLLPFVFFEGVLPVLNQNPGTLFAAGLIFDLVQGKTLGLTSATLLVFGIFFYFLRDQILERKVFVAGFVVLFNMIRQRLVFGDFSLWNYILVFLLIIVFSSLFLWNSRPLKIKFNE
jgi:hypothetical protein